MWFNSHMKQTSTNVDHQSNASLSKPILITVACYCCWWMPDQGPLYFRPSLDMAKLLRLQHYVKNIIFGNNFVDTIYSQIFAKSSSFCRTWEEHVVYKNCFECQKQFLYTTCSPQVWAWNFHVLSLWFNKQSVVILWVSWCKNKSFWQIFTYNLWAWSKWFKQLCLGFYEC